MPVRASKGNGDERQTIRNLGARMQWVISTTLRPLYPRERPCTNRTWGWVDFGVDLDRHGKSSCHRDKIPGLSSQ